MHKHGVCACMDVVSRLRGGAASLLVGDTTVNPRCIGVHFLSPPLLQWTGLANNICIVRHAYVIGRTSES